MNSHTPAIAGSLAGDAKALHLPLKQTPYTIYIGSNLIHQPSFFAPHCSGEQVLIVSNNVVAPLYLKDIQASLKNVSSDKKRDSAQLKVHSLLIEDGEIHKSRESYFKILDYLVEHNFRRNDTIIALGGGVIGDLAGFAAASFQRGMGLIQVPTSLLSQVDSSVGGKTAINHPQGKNLIGAFYQPKCVIIDSNTLNTLPEREYLSGLGEVVKYALLGEKRLEQLLQDSTAELLARDKSILSELIYLCCQMKAKIVEQDEKELGLRALLNLGHTFGHAIETLTQYNKYLHGEAVAVGIMMALRLSLEKGHITADKLADYQTLFEKLGLSTHLDDAFDTEKFIGVMLKDKKNQNASIRLVLVEKEGCIIQEESNKALLATVIKEYTYPVKK